jgi:hypothetical protein
MAIESQGIIISRIGTAATNVITHTATGLAFTNASVIVDDAGGANFVTDKFSTGMRLYVTGGVQNLGQVFTIKAVAATAINLYGAFATAEDAIGMTIVGENYDTIGEITGFNGPTGSANIIDVTNLNSTAKEKMIGLRDEGQLSLDLNLNASAESNQMLLKTDRANRTLRKFDIKLTDIGTTSANHIPSGMNFDAYVSGFAITGSVDNAVKASITLEITSAVKWISRSS